MKAIAAVFAALAMAAGTVGSSSAATAVSSNWAGYAVTGTSFKTVSGTWVQPTANCSSSTAETTASAFWVGLGGDSDTSSALEQAGTEADCLANGDDPLHRLVRARPSLVGAGLASCLGR